jgi:hypothetical protein
LSQNTSDHNSGLAFAALEKRFPAAAPEPPGAGIAL